MKAPLAGPHATDIVRPPLEFHKTWSPSPLLVDSAFQKPRTPDSPDAIPPADAWKNDVPRPFWEGHDEVVACYRRAFEIVGSKIRSPEPSSGFTRNYVFTRFSGAVFVWGCCFITLFGKYANHIFPFIQTLENFYGAQDSDGFIPRELDITSGRSAFSRDDPSAVGGNLFAWAEWEAFQFSGDTQRLRDVYPALLAYHRWMRKHRTWQNHTYFASGWGCGMDNIPRFDSSRYSLEFDHGHTSFIDVTLQQIFNARNLLNIARAADIPTGVDELSEELDLLTRFVNEHMWDEHDGLYKDLDRDGHLVACNHIGSFWALLAQVAPPERVDRLLAALNDPTRFSTPCGTASLAKDNPGFEPNGGNYWRGGVWCITEYMIVKGLLAQNRIADAHRIARKHVEAIARIFTNTGTIWESYSPSAVEPGKVWGSWVRQEFVGFSGVTPIAMFIEAVLGIHASTTGIDWYVNLTEAHGIHNLHLADGTVIDLECAARATPGDRPVITVTTSRPIPIVIHYANTQFTL